VQDDRTVLEQVAQEHVLGGARVVVQLSTVRLVELVQELLERRPVGVTEGCRRRRQQRPAERRAQDETLCNAPEQGGRS